MAFIMVPRDCYSALFLRSEKGKEGCPWTKRKSYWQLEINIEILIIRVKQFRSASQEE